jgi:hypothetical protein
MQHHLAHGSYHHAYLQLIRISEASEVKIHVKAFAAASYVATTYNSTAPLCTPNCNMHTCHTHCEQVDPRVHSALGAVKIAARDCRVTILLLLNAVCIQ